MNRNLRLGLLVVFVITMGFLLKATLSRTPLPWFNQRKQVDYGLFLKEVDQGDVIASGKFYKNVFLGKYSPSAHGNHGPLDFQVALPPEAPERSRLMKLLSEKGVSFGQEPEGPMDFVLASLFPVLAFLLLAGVIYMVFSRAAQNGNNQALNFTKSRIRRPNENVPKVTFDDVAGVEEAKQELQEIVDFLKNARRFQALGAKIPKGVLLLGPPGSGKTLLARAIAGEAQVPFFHISGSDFVEMFVGVGASRVRDLFDTARQNRPALVFIDEIDAVGRQRGAGWGGGHDEREQTLNQLLVEMDGFDPNAGVILIAATNRPDVLDPALLRPGRFDRRVVVDAPDAKGREAILGVHTRGKPMGDDVNLESISKRTPGFAGAELANLVNEAAILAARREKTKIEMAEFEEAIDREMMGPARKNRLMTTVAKRRTAVHEAGHALIAELLANANPLHKVTILPRGRALGVTITLPTEDRYNQTKAEMEDMIAMALGGRIAEILTYGQDGGLDTGASNDLGQVTEIARAMVCEFGMSERIGNRRIGKRHGGNFLGPNGTMEERDYSDEVAKIVDEDIQSIIDRNYKRAEDILHTNRVVLDRLADALMERETLDRDEFLALIQDAIAPVVGGRQPEPPTKPEPPVPPAPPAPSEPSEPTRPTTPRPRLEPGMA
ncbi:ATP-dependent zinc metalloprotease FtsH [Armatimonas rosea]|uniref:ATP-dependent zinc metalloprotease FtsH n=1 Tax=Armatimonas rosea TaxID=685828 RepID=A0A7W9W5Y3_ARMRO|nr:ATP-dependent zinc metalloprotease FtsH [Armatimonas rosea]MBB6050058.1 cell division protease FtsH [Armatimonas rosea]